MFKLSKLLLLLFFIFSIQPRTKKCLKAKELVVLCVLKNFGKTYLCGDTCIGKKLTVDGKIYANDDINANKISATQLNLRSSAPLGSKYTGFKSPSDLSSSYTLTLPSSPSGTGQALRTTAGNSNIFEWYTPSGGGGGGGTATPSAMRTVYVTKDGNDSTGDGSFDSPYLTVAKGVSVANSLSSATSPIRVAVGAGTFEEDNSGSPIEITSSGVSVVGTSIDSTIIKPNTLSNNLFSVTASGTEISFLTLDAGSSGSSSATGIRFASITGVSRLQSVAIYRMSVGLSVSTPNGIIVGEDVQPRGCATGISVTDSRLLLKNSVFLGSFTGSTQANTGVTVTGSDSLVTMLSCSFRAVATAVSLGTNATLSLVGSNIDDSTNGVVCSGSSKAEILGTVFTRNNSSIINVSVSGAGTDVTINGCTFDGRNSSGNPQGIGLKVTDEGYGEVIGSHLDFLTTAVVAGQAGDSSSTEVVVSSSFIHDNTNDISQGGSATLELSGTSVSSPSVSLNDPANVTLTTFDLDDNAVLSIGNTENQEQDLIIVNNGFSTSPRFKYFPSFYGHDSLVYDNQVSEGASGVGFGVVSQAAGGILSLMSLMQIELCMQL